MKRELRSLRHVAQGYKVGRVLSIGCGEGLFESLLAPFADSILGIDLSGEAVRRAQARAVALNLRHVEFKCLPLSELSWEDTFDCVVCLAFLHHVYEPELPELLRSIHAHLKPGGFFYAQDPSRNGVLRKIGRIILGSHYDHYHSADERELDPVAIAKELRTAGFASVKIGWIDWTLIPIQYLFPNGPDWLMWPCSWMDRVLCATPLARWASGFTTFASRHEEVQKSVQQADK
jgi:SAM-dependent methyltransferase